MNLILVSVIFLVRVLECHRESRRVKLLDFRPPVRAHACHAREVGILGEDHREGFGVMLIPRLSEIS